MEVYERHMNECCKQYRTGFITHREGRDAVGTVSLMPRYCPECGDWLEKGSRVMKPEPKPVRQEAIEAISALRDALDSAPRLGSCEDIPEGARYIQITDTFATELATRCRAICRALG